jgi:hypothetical protein
MYRGFSLGKVSKTKPDFTIKISGLSVLNDAWVISNLEFLSAIILILLVRKMKVIILKILYCKD